MPEENWQTKKEIYFLTCYVWDSSRKIHLFKACYWHTCHNLMNLMIFRSFVPCFQLAVLTFACCSYRWHRLAYSVIDKKITLYLDCEKVTTIDLPRGDDPKISTEGVTVFGRRLLEEEVFEVCNIELHQSTCMLKLVSRHWNHHSYWNAV